MNDSTSFRKSHSLFNRGFIALLITQFTVAFNDNAFRWLLVPIGKCYADNDIIRVLGGVFLLIPFLIWTSIAGYVTDRFSRRRIMIWCKIVEFILLLAAIFIIAFGPSVDNHRVVSSFPPKIIFLLVILFLIGSQSAFFSPSKYSVIPDIVPETKLSAANGFVAMLTMLACVLGQVVGGYVYFWTTNFYEETIDNVTNIQVTGIPGAENIWITAIVLLGIALIGLVASLFIPKLKAVAPDSKFPRNPFVQTYRDLKTLFSYKKLFWIAVASAFFWGLAAIATNNIDKFATEYLKVQQQYVTILIAILSIGIGFGALVCGFLSGKKIELGFVPIGAIGMGVMIFILGLTPAYKQIIGEGMGNPLNAPYIFASIMMIIMGLFAGFYDVPLAAYIQRNSPEEKRGRMLAAYNFLSFSIMIFFLIAGMVGVIVFNAVNKMKIVNYDPSLLIWMSTGLFTALVGVVLLYYLWDKFLMNFFRLLLIFLYRPKVIGLENIPESGGFVMTSNHISLIDGMLIESIFPRNIRFLAFEPMIPKWFEPLIRETRLIKLLPGKKAVIAIKAAREGLREGDIIGIFPEGGITRNGQMRQFESGFLSILKGEQESPVVPVYVHGLFGSMFSYKFGDKIKFPPKVLPTGVVIAFGKPIYNPENSLQIQQAVQELGAEICHESDIKRHPIPARALIKTCKKRKFIALFADADSNDLNDSNDSNANSNADTNNSNNTNNTNNSNNTNNTNNSSDSNKSGNSIVNRPAITGGKFLENVLLLRRLLNSFVLSNRKSEQNIGILIPDSIISAIVNGAITIDRRVAINLDYQLDVQTINAIIRNEKVKRVVMSRKFENFFKKIESRIEAEIIFAEDIFDRATLIGKLSARFGAIICPRKILEFQLGLLSSKRYKDIVTIIYSNKDNVGEIIAEDKISDKLPVGIVWTNSNLLEAERGFVDAMRLNKDDVIFGNAQFSQPMGYAGVLWSTFFSGGASFLRGSRALISVTKNQLSQATQSTTQLRQEVQSNLQSTFQSDENSTTIQTLDQAGEYRREKIYSDRICLSSASVSFLAADFVELEELISDKNLARGGFDFSRVKTVICGVDGDGVVGSIDKILGEWESKFGVRPVTGFFAKELVLFATMNVPAIRKIDDFHTYNKEGSMGRPIAGVAIKVINPETEQDAKPNEVGVIIIKSSTISPTESLMITELKNDWYKTKIKAKIDGDGFVWFID
ncbi:MAG: MFS transporter [Planctomycetaceae bacterium]|jgi:acyl-[acyl-carrier-protein]-phospholipid O-acyltransferase/long-chain-fatty-acid--[acyl-carrier-protein] ligase|nr:MFS transporter [Planctomycetaceae bacterium]